jgi:CIC family chloride channel protein
MKFHRKNMLRALVKTRRMAHLVQTILGKFKRAEHIMMIIASILIGLLGGFGAIGFRYIIKIAHALFFQTWEYSLSVIEAFSWWERMLIPALGGLLVGPIVYKFASEVKGSGVPEVMESVALRGGSIRLRVLLAKTFAAAITIGSGGSAGREGPIIQIGSAIGSTFGQFLKLSAPRMRTFVACGAAAGIAATFNAPIAGALFAIEVILGDFVVTQFSPIVISSVVATVLSRHFIGDFPAFNVPRYEMISAYEFIPYTIIGICAGLISVFFIMSVYKTQDVFENFKMPQLFKPALGGLIVGVIAIGYPQVYGVGYESINDALWGKDVTLLLAVLIFLKIFATSATLGSGGSGGVFAPSLFIGAMLGGLIGEQTHSLFPEITANSGAYALVGMGAVVAGVTHAPISAILIIFELTNNYLIIPPLMTACIISVLLSTLLKRESMYTMKLVKRGIRIFEGKDINILRSIKVDEVINSDIVTIPKTATFQEIIQLMLNSQHQEYFVIDSNKKLNGILSFHQLKEFLLEGEYLSNLVIASDLVEQNYSVVYPEDNLDLIMHQFGRSHVDELPVVKSARQPVLLGSVRRLDIIDKYNKEIFKRDLAGGIHSVVTAVQKEREVELADNYSFAEIDLPDGFVGRRIKDLDIRKRYGVEIILIKKPFEDGKGLSSRPGVIPSADHMFSAGEKILVLGNTSQIKKLKTGNIS